MKYKNAFLYNITYPIYSNWKLFEIIIYSHPTFQLNDVIMLSREGSKLWFMLNSDIVTYK